MSKPERLTRALRRAADMERTVLDFYSKARNDGKKHDDPFGDLLHAIEHDHLHAITRLDARREAIERSEGEGWFGEMMESISEAIESVVGGMPAEFVHATTPITIDLLVHAEERLLELYQTLRPAADEQTAALIDGRVEETTRHIERLRAFDGRR